MAEQAQVAALQACGGPIPKPKLTREKGSDLQVDAAEAGTFRLRQQATMRELKLRKLLGRIPWNRNPATAWPRCAGHLESADL